MYCAGTTTADLWMWSSSRGWLWTSNSVYPFLWSDTAQAWLYYYSGSGDGSGGWFHNFANGQTTWL